MKKKLLITSAISLLTSYIAFGQFTKLLDCVSPVTGNYPWGSLISDGTFLYGMTSSGGNGGSGTVFKIKPNGTGYTDLLDFAGGNNGATPYGSLFDDGTFLYGMTSVGGASDSGIIFKIKPDGTGYADLLDFTGANNGATPYGSLISDGTYLYGMTSQGGTNNDGVIFKIKPDGTGYSKLFDFTGPTGSNPFGSLYYDGTFLYGMTSYGGGTDGDGVIFKIKPDGTGYSKLLDFLGATNGKYPGGDLISDGTFLYGMTYFGGANNEGTIFKIKPDGTGYSNMLDLSTFTYGSDPYGSFIFDGTFLYGITQNGGLNDFGTIFKIKPDGTGYSNLFNFGDVASGKWPYGSLISDGTFLYGMTQRGGINDEGTVFKLGGVLTGITGNNEENDLTVHPNPTNGVFTIQLATGNWQLANSQKPQASIEIYNVMGECIHRQIAKSSNQQIDLSSQPNGIYFLQIKSENGIIIKKIVINR